MACIHPLFSQPLACPPFRVPPPPPCLPGPFSGSLHWIPAFSLDTCQCSLQVAPSLSLGVIKMCLIKRGDHRTRSPTLVIRELMNLFETSKCSRIHMRKYYFMQHAASIWVVIQVETVRDFEKGLNLWMIHRHRSCNLGRVKSHRAWATKCYQRPDSRFRDNRDNPDDISYNAMLSRGLNC